MADVMNENATEQKEVKLTSKDFVPPGDVRWCPGCGDYSILAQVQRIFPELGIKKEDYVWVSGIGCSSRFPYYMDTFGFHGIHGRAPAIASGVKTARPDLAVWVATGDGDLLSIGGNHFIHSCRKNMDLKVLLFNNRIYGLTKGQYSPTSERGKKTRSSPYGSVDYPFNPPSLAAGAGATFVARTLDRDVKHMQYVIQRAAAHKGFAFVEVYQNCNIFNDGAFLNLTEKDTKPDNVVVLEHGKPMLFGKNNEKGIMLDGLTPKVIDLSEGKYTVDDVWVHNEFEESPARAMILANFADMENMPTPIGVFRQIIKPTYDAEVQEQINGIKAKKGEGDLQKLLFSGNTWEVQ